jgi:mono/diheme cytochrome c family protein
VVTSRGSADAIVWVLDENARRSAPLAGPAAPRPVLYALDAMTLELLWKSAPGELHTSGKYNEPAFAHGMVFVGTDRIQAFGERSTAPDGRLIYQQRCAACHENPGGRIPPRELLALRSRPSIVAALTDGVMRPYAMGLSTAEIDAVARYLQ